MFRGWGHVIEEPSSGGELLRAWSIDSPWSKEYLHKEIHRCAAGKGADGHEV
jgi:hypothetical protein